MMIFKISFINAPVELFGTNPAANVHLAKTKACALRMNSSTLRPANACVCQLAVQMEKPLTTANANAKVVLLLLVLQRFAKKQVIIGTLKYVHAYLVCQKHKYADS